MSASVFGLLTNVYINGLVLKLLVTSVSISFAYLVIKEVRYFLVRSIDLENPENEELKKYSSDRCKVIVKGGSDFSERSTLLKKSISVPINHHQFRKVSKDFYVSRIVHEIGHSEFRDFLVLNLYLVVLFISVSILIALNLANPDPAPNPLPEYSNTNASYFFGFSLIAVLISLCRLMVFLRVREYRADQFAASMLGDKFRQFIEHQVLKASFGRHYSIYHLLLNSLTHPSFKSRLERLKKPGDSVGQAFLEGVYWPFLFLFAVMVFIAAILMQANLFPEGPSKSPPNNFEPLLLAATSICSVIGIGCFIYGISKVQYAFMLGEQRLSQAIIFSFSSAVSLGGLISIFLWVGYSSYGINADYFYFGAVILASCIWLCLLFVFNYAIFLSSSKKTHMPITRFAWSAISFFYAWHIPPSALELLYKKVSFTQVFILLSIFICISLFFDLFRANKRLFWGC